MFNFIKTNKPENINDEKWDEIEIDGYASLLEENRLLSNKITRLEEELGELKNPKEKYYSEYHELYEEEIERMEPIVVIEYTNYIQTQGLRNTGSVCYHNGPAVEPPEWTNTSLVGQTKEVKIGYRVKFEGLDSVRYFDINRVKTEYEEIFKTINKTLKL